MDGWKVAEGRGGWVGGWFMAQLASWLSDIVLMPGYDLTKPFAISGRQQSPREQPGGQNHPGPAAEEQLFPMRSSVRSTALLRASLRSADCACPEWAPCSAGARPFQHSLPRRGHRARGHQTQLRNC